MKKKEFDVIVIGAGSGLSISSAASGLDYTVAVVEPGHFGGTCLNRGCIPSKILIHSADVSETVKRSRLFDISSKLTKVHWKKLIERVNTAVDDDARQIETGNRRDKNITSFKSPAKFVDNKTLRVGGQLITARKIFICAGARPFIPPIPGLDTVPFMTSNEALRLKTQPKHLIIIGGGYIGCELAHFYGSLGTKITIIDRGNSLMKYEDADISARFTEVYQRKFNLVLNSDIVRVFSRNNKITCEVKTKHKTQLISGDALLVATGRIPNSDTLDVDKAGIKTDIKGFIEVNDYLETSASNIWAIGDIIGKYMFKHSANLEASCAFHNAFGKKLKIDYTAMPHAAFTSPQVAGVGRTEKELLDEKVEFEKSIYPFNETGYGLAIQDNDGFVKVLWDKKTRKILGCHIIGTHASILIHEVIVAMKAGLGINDILNSVHIHPSLSEVIQRAFRSRKE